MHCIFEYVLGFCGLIQKLIFFTSSLLVGTKQTSNKNKLFHGFDISMHSCDDDWSEQGSVSMIQWVNN